MVVRSGCLDLAHTSVTDLARMSGWNKKRVEKALHACLLSPTKDEGDRFTRYCGELRGAGERPYIELIKAGNGAVKSSYRYVGIAPLPSRTGPRGPCPQHTGALHPTFPTDLSCISGPVSTLRINSSHALLLKAIVKPRPGV